MVKKPTDDEDIDSLIAMAEGELSQVGNASSVGDTDDVDSLIAMAEQEITQPDEKGDYGWFKNEMSKHGQEFMQDPSAGPLIKMGGDVARSFGYTMGKVFEPVTKPIVEGVTQHLSRVVPEGEKQFVKDVVAGGTEAYRNAIPDEGVRDLISSTGSIISLGLGAKSIGAGESTKGLVKVAGESTKKTGEVVEDFGKTIKAGELKMTNAIAKKGYGEDLIEKKKNIIKDAADFGITHGNNEDGSAMALEMARQRFDKADEIATSLAADPNTPMLNPVEIAMKGISSRIAPTGFRKQAQSKIQDVIDDMASDGHDQPVTLDQLIKAKQNLNADGKLFINGPAGSDADPVGTSIRRKAYLNIVDAIGEVSPEIKAMNVEGKKLLDVNAAFSNAASRIANHDAIGLTDFVLGGASIANPGALAVAAPMFVTKKALGNGRAGNLIINIGRRLQGKTPNTIESTLDNLRPKVEPRQPITDKSRLLPYQMVQGPGDLAQPIPVETMVNGVRTVKTKMDIPVGAKIRNLGESGAPEFDYKAPPVKPTPPVPKQLTDRSAKALPPPMIGKSTQEVQPAIASIGARAREIDRRIAALGEVKDLEGKPRKLTTFEELSTRHKDPFNYADPDAKAKPATEPHIYSDDPRVKDLLTPAQYKKLVKGEGRRVAANKNMLSDVETGNLDETLTPDQFKKKSLIEYEKHMNNLNKPISIPEAEKASLVSSLVKKLGVGGNNVVFKDLSTDKKQVVLDLVNRLNSNKQAWNEFYDKGILDKPYVQGESNIHQDDIVDMINSFNNTKLKKSLKDIKTK